MALYKKKQKKVDAEQFNSAGNPNTWPDGVQVNPLSATGYSYGTLEQVPADELPGETKRDGFEVSDSDYVVEEKNGSVYRMIEAEFLEQYEV